MIIARDMNLGQLLYLMPDDATYAEADRFRAALARAFPGVYASDVPRHAWDALLAGN